MKPKKNILIRVCLLALIMQVLFSACTGVTTSEEAECSKYLPYKIDTNYEFLEITIEPRFNDFLIGRPIELFVENISDQEIWIPRDGFIQIFEIAKCTELVDLVNRDASTDVVLTPRGSPESAIIFPVLPRINTPLAKMDIVIFLSGYLYENDQPTEQRITTSASITLYQK
jgi:hypothetical protein